MSYTIEPSRSSNLEDTAIPNLFITDFMPDVPDGDFVKVYIYAYMCCRQGIALTHAELADRLGLETENVISAWRYFAGRHLVRLFPQTPEDRTHFDVEFVDIKGQLYVKGDSANGRQKKSLADPALETLFQKIMSICGTPSIDGSDVQRILSWIEDDGATPEIIEYAFLICKEEQNQTRITYVEKPVKEWAAQGLKTVGDVREYRVNTNARCAVHKQLMEALGLRYSVITPAEAKIFDLWIDDYGYTPKRLLELAAKTEGVNNKFKYLGGIIRKEREAEGKGKSAGSGKGKPKDREDYYREIRRMNEELAEKHLEEIYEKLSEIKDIDDELVAMNMEMMKTLRSGSAGTKNVVERLNKEIAAMHGSRADILKSAGFAPDYTDLKYNCSLCNDTGVRENGTSCDCYKG